MSQTPTMLTNQKEMIMVYKKRISPLVEFRDVSTLAYLWHKCYKMGIEDTIKNGNIHYCLNWVADRREDKTFARLADDNEYFFEKWSALLLSWSYDIPKTHWKRIKTIFGYITSNKIYMSVVYDIAMVFYLYGIEDYCNRANSKEASLFFSKELSLWNEQKNVISKIDKVLLIAEKARWYCLNQDLTERKYHQFARMLDIACHKFKNKQYM